MDATLDYKILSRRDPHTVTFKEAPKTHFYTNFFSIKLDKEKSIMYQYAFKLGEEIPQDSILYQKAIKSITRELKEKCGFLCFKGQIFWGTKFWEIPFFITCSFPHGGKEYKLSATISHTRTLNLADLDVKETRDQLLQILNIDLKASLSNSEMSQFGKNGQFFPKKLNERGIPELYQMGIILQRGFKFTLVPLDFGLSLQIDICSSVLQSKSVWDLIQHNPNEQTAFLIKNSIVYTRYGSRRRTYHIIEIDNKLTPKSKFFNEKKGLEMTYEDYYLEAYGIKVKYPKQPLLKAIGRVNQVIKDGKIEKTPEYIYLIPEFVSPTGLANDQKNNFNTMKTLAPYTKLEPKQRVTQCLDIVDKINKAQGLIKIEKAREVEGVILEKPDVSYKSLVKPSEEGIIKNRGPLYAPKRVKDWVFISGPDLKEEEARQCMSLLMKAARTYGINIDEAGEMIISRPGVENWIREIKKDFQEKGTPEIAVFLLLPKEERYYSDLKSFLINKLRCPSQFVRKRTLISQKGALSAASKIAIQMNVKVGATPWVVSKSHPYFKAKSIMYGALSLSGGKKGYTLAFVGTILNDCSKVYSEVKMEISRKEEIPVNTLEEIFINWAKNYFQNNGRVVPSTIILYREGLSDPQIRDQLPRTEIPALQGMVTKIGEKTKTVNYNPEIIIVVVNKKINSRYYSMHKDTPVNPRSGSVIVEPFAVDENYSFHLAAQQVTQGTCTPTLFKVGYDKSNMPKEALINFTFDQCFNYYNWEGAVRVPACLQCANKLAKLFGEHIKAPLQTSNLLKTHFFL